MTKPDETTITNAQTRLFLGDELLPHVVVDIVEWAERRAAHVHISGTLDTLDALEKVTDGVDLDVIAFCHGDVRNHRRGHLIASFKQLWDVHRWIDNLIVNHPSGEVRLTMNVSFMCSLEFAK